ncbi:Uricase [Dendrobium catenatum]|uniref:factor independent urate hydroxylase n=1 Tax=Dendrobium catenatum TaxID=906689 RepID=A0A2I0VLX7_9ASPA|nr:Uricase [Dendrobium catenatum]
MIDPIKIHGSVIPDHNWSLVYLVRGGCRPNLTEGSLSAAMGCFVQGDLVDMGFQFESISAIPTESKFFIERYRDVKKVIVDTFFGPPTSGVYSPSVQNTLYLMAVAVLNRFPDIASIQLRMPNIHFLPVNLSSKDNPNLVKISKHLPLQFADDVYLPTDEPHGTIEATLSRPPLSKL